MKGFMVELLPIKGVDDFTRVPISKSSGELQIRHDGILFDGYFYLWEEIESVKVFRHHEKGKR